MTWSLVQKSAAGASVPSGSSIDGTLPAASSGSASAPTLVVAFLMSTGGTNTWDTLPSGWVLDTGATVLNGLIRASVAYFVDTGTHVGTTATFGNSVATSNLRCWMAEYATDVTSAVITLNARGTGVAGATDRVSAATGTAADTGDLAAFAACVHYTAGTAITWTDPSGFTLTGSDGAGTGGNHLYAAHDLSAAAGTLTVQGLSSVASTSSTGWAAVAATFTASPPAAATTPYVGAYNTPSVWGAGTTTQQALNDFQSVTGRTMAVRRVFFGQGSTPAAITTDLQADADAGRRALISIAPAYPGTDQDRNIVDGFLASCKAAGLDAKVALWQEPVTRGIAAADFITAFRYYATTVRQYYPVVFCTSAGHAWNAGANSFYPGDAWTDECATDFYGSAYAAGVRLGTGAANDPSYPADHASPAKPFGIWEFMTSTDPSQGQSQSLATTVWGYLKSYLTGRRTAGQPLGDVTVFNSAQNLAQETPIITADGTAGYGGVTEYRVALFDALYDAYNGISGAGVLNITTASVPDGEPGVTYPGATLAAAGGTTPYTWAVTAGSLPSGLSLSSGGVLSGTPSAAGTYSFTVTVTDAVSAADTQAFTVTVAAAPVLGVTTSALPDGEDGSAYSQDLAAAGGTTPYTWAVTAGSLPSGLSLSSGGTISGTPDTAGTATFTAEVTDAGSATATASLTITVAATLTVTTATLDDGAVAVPYAAALAVSGGSGTVTWSVTAGSLPAGLTLTSDGALSGIPSAAALGTASFTVTAADDYTTAAADLTLTVAAVASLSMLSFDPALFRVRVDLAAVHAAAGTGWWYMSAASYIHSMYVIDPVTTALFFDTASAYAISTDATSTGILDGLACTPVLKYTAYAQLVADTSGTDQTVGGHTFTARAIDAAFQWVLYDTEDWGDITVEPQEEVDDPWTYMASFTTLAQSNGFNVILTPARDLGNDATSVHPKLAGEILDDWYVRTNIAGTAAGTGAEIIHIQDQANQEDLAEFGSFWARARAQAITGGAAQVSIGVSTAYGGAAAMTAAMATVSPSGVWLNALTPSAAVQFLQSAAVYAADVQRSSDGVTWADVRGGAAVTVAADSPPADDYEYAPGAVSYYRVVTVSHGAWGDDITPVQDTAVLKNIRYPFLNVAVDLSDASDLTYPSRGGVFDIPGRARSVAVTSVAGAAQFDITVATETAADRAALLGLLATGDVLLLQVPPHNDYGEAYPADGGYYTVQQGGSVTETRGGMPWERRWITIPLSPCTAPAASVVPVTSVWQTVTDRYATWAGVTAALGTWADVLALVASPSDVYVA